ncbi:Serine/threonine protein kinase ULK3 [Entamoeba marina]
MPELQHFIKQIIEGMWYMYYHKHLIHRDLKLENFLLCQSPPNLPLLKIGDFGFSRCIGDNQMQTFQGTLHFASPEILRQQIYSSKCDLYSLGITLYKMATGTFPSNNDPNYSGNVDVFPCYIQNDHTFDLFCDLVKKLTLEEHERPDWNEFLNHPFVLNILEGSIVYQELEKFIADKMNALPNNENKSFF